MVKSIMQTEKRCYLCGSTATLEIHHCLHGTGLRKLADKYGLTVWLCAICHRDNVRGAHGNHDVDLRLKQDAQKAFEKKHGHEKYMEIFGRNYL